MNKPPKLVMGAFVFSLVVYPALSEGAETAQTMKQAKVNGYDLAYFEQGSGAPVVFVHGAASDHRSWDLQQEVVAQRYRSISIDQRYFGTNPWPDDGAKYSQATHVADLAAFIRELKTGPVHLVGRSYGANIALVLALQHPELVRSVFVNEPGFPSIVTDAADLATVTEERKGLASARAAAKEGRAAEATRLLIDWVNAQPGGFDALAPAARSMVLDYARTVPLHLAAPPPAPITCAQLGQIKMPVAITKGQLTRPYYKILAETASRCIPGSRLITIPDARHGSPSQNPAVFNEALMGFLAKN